MDGNKIWWCSFYLHPVQTYIVKIVCKHTLKIKPLLYLNWFWPSFFCTTTMWTLNHSKEFLQTESTTAPRMSQQVPSTEGWTTKNWSLIVAIRRNKHHTFLKVPQVRSRALGVLVSSRLKWTDVLRVSGLLCDFTVAGDLTEMVMLCWGNKKKKQHTAEWRLGCLSQQLCSSRAEVLKSKTYEVENSAVVHLY